MKNVTSEAGPALGIEGGAPSVFLRLLAWNTDE